MESVTISFAMPHEAQDLDTALQSKLFREVVEATLFRLDALPDTTTPREVIRLFHSNMKEAGLTPFGTSFA